MFERLLQSLFEFVGEIWYAESQVHNAYDNVIINLHSKHKISNNCVLNFCTRIGLPVQLSQKVNANRNLLDKSLIPLSNPDANKTEILSNGKAHPSSPRTYFSTLYEYKPKDVYLTESMNSQVFSVTQIACQIELCFGGAEIQL